MKYFARYRKQTDTPSYERLTRCADELREISEILEKMDPCAAVTRAAAMGFEGRAAAKYWAAFGTLVPSRWSFPGRNTRNASDPVNSVINYVYGMIYGEVWRSVVRAGLDPYFGIMHGTERDQGSLVFDLIEEFRAPFGDRLVLGMLGRGFSLDLNREGRLRSVTRRKLVAAFRTLWHRALRWRGRVSSPAKILEAQVNSLKNVYLEAGEYAAYRFRW